MHISDTTVVLPGPAGDVDIFLDVEEVAQQFAITETPDGVPILSPGIEARFPVNTRAPLVGGLEQIDERTGIALGVVAAAALLFFLTRQ